MWDRNIWIDDFSNHSLWPKTTIKAQLQTSDSNFRPQRSEEFVLRANGQAHSLLYRVYCGAQVERRRSQSQASHSQIDQMHASASATLPGMEAHVDRNTNTAGINHPVGSK